MDYMTGIGSFKNPTRESLQLTGFHGHRTVIPAVLTTQHNKIYKPTPSFHLRTDGRRAFTPRSPADLGLGDVVKFTRPNGRMCIGTVKFIGHLQGKHDTFVGLQLQNSDGNHDGVYNGVKYFDCKPGRGAFITFGRIIMAWSV